MKVVKEDHQENGQIEEEWAENEKDSLTFSGCTQVEENYRGCCPKVWRFNLKDAEAGCDSKKAPRANKSSVPTGRIQKTQITKKNTIAEKLLKDERSNSSER